LSDSYQSETKRLVWWDSQHFDPQSAYY